jgi:methionine-rich copper-binding protein CopC
MTASSSRAPFLAMAVAMALFLLLPTVVAAHSELDVPTPADKATVEGTPAEIFGTFTQTIKAAGSSLVLRDGAGTEVATGGLDPADEHRMVITDVPELAPGEYEVEWTTISAEDDELARGVWSFTVTAAPTPTPTDSPPPSASPSPSPTAELTSAPSPSASPAPTDPGGTAGDDAILPIIAALAIVLIAAVYLVSRRGRPSGGA